MSVQDSSLARQTAMLVSQNEQQRSEIEQLRDTIGKLREELEKKTIEHSRIQDSNRILKQQQERAESRVKELERNILELRTDYEARLGARERDSEAREANFAKLENELKVCSLLSLCLSHFWLFDCVYHFLMLTFPHFSNHLLTFV